MFQFRRFPSYAYLIQRRMTEYCSAGLPHSEISGSMRMCRSPKLIAACHVLRRFLMPRHSPCALISLTSSAQTALIPFPAPLKTSYLSVAPPLRIKPASLGFDPVERASGFTVCAVVQNQYWFSQESCRLQSSCSAQLFLPFDGTAIAIPIQFPQSKTFPLLLALFLPFWNFTLFSFQGALPGLI